ncbi:MAG: alkyl hydroperoxide reductase subunit alkyl hydroperoxide reductase subunit [Candidatus Taylorbacteria bacterium]|nr:alkyl hydroperoxide reductase subunit alkyl hydroperoxide reductase subunit [Candidatus Taylorbacteria bacterium]
MNNTQYELIIIGGGPAGVAAGVYAARKRIKTLLLTYSFESQSVVSEKIENWIGTVAISGADFAKNMEAHLRAYAGESVEIKTGDKVKTLRKIEGGFEVEMEKGEKFTTKTALITSGSVRRKLDAKGADIYEHKGLTYCATCDGPLYDGQDVLVIGGGNAAFETTAQLAAYCKSVTIINRGDTFRADPVTVEKVLSKPNVTAIKNAISLEVKGDKFVNGFVYKDATTNEEKNLDVTGIFVEIGLLANTEYAAGIVDRNPVGQIIVNPRTQESSTKGIWSAGDCTDGLYHQNNIAAGDAVKALEDIYNYLHTK